nr:nucleotidyltransferase domain-containing protein [Rhizobium sp. TCK]
MIDTALDRLRGGDASRWSYIAKAQSRSAERLEALSKLAEGLLPTDEGSFVVFGSLARGEYTAGSDLDWTVLIDGRADSLHLQIVHKLTAELDRAGFAKPGPTEVFGGLIFSHDLVHAVGGDEDSNKNMTRRLLLLLESTPVRVSGSADTHDRIVQAILNRYVQEDASFIGSNRRADRIPRFLLNDVVRFWRTMAVDYANKYRARAGQKWALRNIKLRMSRKLLFVSGLFMCLSWALQERSQHDIDYEAQDLVDHLLAWTKRSPLSSLAEIVEQYAPSLAPDVFDNYDAFLALLDDEVRRKRLEDLSPEAAYVDDVFLEARELASHFDAALTELLFDANAAVATLVKKYGVF